ncbi:hypothetical protein D9615_003654 [Tricholomella constricta]|uniref:Protein kinase domain-containing protein n=1 Tax=Tricholomella constricta TaxID=117010 RepID=A0A8H5HIC9_9AGAR|nr:hypothetical protein D9615_003654 [Tricholomella constricta]
MPTYSSASHSSVTQDVQEISRLLKKEPKLVRDLNTVLPLDLTVHCPADVEEVEFVVLIASRSGEILSTSGSVAVLEPFSTTLELGVSLPQNDEWQRIESYCSTNPQWASCVSQLLQRELDDPNIDDSYKQVVSRRQIHLAKRTSSLPPSLFLLNLEREDNYHSSGGFADIVRGKIKDKVVCLKVLRQYSRQGDLEKKSKAFFREVLLWSRLDHPNVLPFLGANRSLRYGFVLVSPWMKHGNLSDFLTAHPEHDRLTAAFEIADGLSYLHGLTPPIFHRDVKSANILVSDDLRCCVGDFGLSSIAGSQRLESKSFAGEGTSRWQPPEVLNPELHPEDSEEFPAAADVYAFGCTVLELYTGEVPFHTMNTNAAIVAVLGRKKPELPITGTLGLTEDLRSLVSLSWEFIPQHRPTMSRIRDELKRMQPGIGPPATSDSKYELRYRRDEGSLDDVLAWIDEELMSSCGTSKEGGTEAERSQGDHCTDQSQIFNASSTEGISCTPPENTILKDHDALPSDPYGEVESRVLMTPDLSRDVVNGMVTPSTHGRSTAVPWLNETYFTKDPWSMHIKPFPVKTDCFSVDLLTPPQTPTQIQAEAFPSVTSSRLRAAAPIFLPRPGSKVKVHRLNIDAPAFQPPLLSPSRFSPVHLAPETRNTSPTSGLEPNAPILDPFIVNDNESRPLQHSNSSGATVIDRTPLSHTPIVSEDISIKAEPLTPETPSRLNPSAIPFEPAVRDAPAASNDPRSMVTPLAPETPSRLNPSATPFRYLVRGATTV